MLVAALLACGAPPASPCATPLWRIEQDDPPKHVCAVEIDGDGTTVVLLGGADIRLIEIAVDGVLASAVVLPVPESENNPVCLDLAIDQDGTRIALVALRNAVGLTAAFAYHVRRAGEITQRVLAGPTGHVWKPVRIAIDAGAILVAGIRRADGVDNDIPGEAFVGRVDPIAWRVIDPIVDPSFARVGPITVAQGRVHALLSPSSIDYANRSLIAFDGAAALWRRPVGIDMPLGPDPYVAALIGVGHDVITFDYRHDAWSVARFGPAGDERWRRDADDRVRALDAVRVGDLLVDVATPTISYLDPISEPSRATLRTLQGEWLCDFDLVADVGREVRLAADQAAGTFVTVARTDPYDHDEMRQRLAITAYATDEP